MAESCLCHLKHCVIWSIESYGVVCDLEHCVVCNIVYLEHCVVLNIVSSGVLCHLEYCVFIWGPVTIDDTTASTRATHPSNKTHQPTTPGDDKNIQFFVSIDTCVIVSQKIMTKA